MNISNDTNAPSGVGIQLHRVIDIGNTVCYFSFNIIT